MKYENLMDIPYGYEMQLAGDVLKYPKGTIIVRGHFQAMADDESSVAFKLPDGEWDYFFKQQIEDIPKEKKGMKGSDKVMVELTGYQVATIYALVGVCQTGDKNDGFKLYQKLQNILNDAHRSTLEDDVFPKIIRFSQGFEEKLYKAILEPETPTLTEAQKKALELKETIAKAQKQLEELEKQI